MKNGRIKRNLPVVIIGIVSACFAFFYDLKPVKIINYLDIMSASLSFSALATALFFAVFSLIPAFSNSKLIKVLEELKTDKKLMDRLLVSTTLFFTNSLLSFVALLFSSSETNVSSQIVIILWFSTSLMAISSTFLVIKIIFDVFNLFVE